MNTNSSSKTLVTKSFLCLFMVFFAPGIAAADAACDYCDVNHNNFCNLADAQHLAEQCFDNGGQPWLIPGREWCSDYDRWARVFDYDGNLVYNGPGTDGNFDIVDVSYFIDNSVTLHRGFCGKELRMLTR